MNTDVSQYVHGHTNHSLASSWRVTTNTQRASQRSLVRHQCQCAHRQLLLETRDSHLVLLCGLVWGGDQGCVCPLGVVGRLLILLLLLLTPLTKVLEHSQQVLDDNYKGQDRCSPNFTLLLHPRLSSGGGELPGSPLCRTTLLSRLS